MRWVLTTNVVSLVVHPLITNMPGAELGSAGMRGEP